MRLDAAQLVEGPRARSLCLLAAAEVCVPPLARLLELDVDPDDDAQVATAARLLDGADLAALRSIADPLALLHQVADAVAGAKYWEPPWSHDRFATRPELTAPLTRVAAAILEAPGTAWWSSPVDLDAQREVAFVTPYSRRLADLAGVRARLDDWRREADESEAREARERPRDPRASYSGEWWSTPAGAATPVTTRALPGLAACRLVWAEEEGGDFDDARVRPLRPRVEPRVWEVDSPTDWVALVEAHPLEVTASRRHDWFRVTGRDPRWWIPDWAGVAEHWDAVHVTVAGYLATATRALDLDRLRIGAGTAASATLLAGWSPDETLWLTDVLEPAGPLTGWHDDGPPEPPGPAGPGGWVPQE